MITKFAVAGFKGKVLHYLSHTQELSRGPLSGRGPNDENVFTCCVVVIVVLLLHTERLDHAPGPQLWWIMVPIVMDAHLTFKSYVQSSCQPHVMTHDACDGHVMACSTSITCIVCMENGRLR